MISSQTQLCTTCWEEQSISEFRRVRKGEEERRRECRTCFATYMRERKKNRRHKRVRGLVRQLARPSNRMREVKALVEMLIQHCGGLERFTQTWKEALDAAVQAGDHRFVLQHFFAISRLIQFVAEMQSKEQMPMDDLTDEELEREVGRMVRQQVELDPTRAVGALQELGWSVVAPG